MFYKQCGDESECYSSSLISMDMGDTMVRYGRDHSPWLDMGEIIHQGWIWERSFTTSELFMQMHKNDMNL